MSFNVTTKDIKKNLEPLGFSVEIDRQYEDEDYLRITHPDHEGIVIVAIVINGMGVFDELTRKVEGGAEADINFTGTQEEFNALPQAQQDHSYHIDFGEELDHEALDSISDFVTLVQHKIVPVTTL